MRPGGYADPVFDYGAHDRWVAAGYCPVVSRVKAYCCLQPGKLAEVKRATSVNGWPVAFVLTGVGVTGYSIL